MALEPLIFGLAVVLATQRRVFILDERRVTFILATSDMIHTHGMRLRQRRGGRVILGCIVGAPIMLVVGDGMLYDFVESWRRLRDRYHVVPS